MSPKPRLAAAALLGSLLFCACASWQGRADQLQKSLDDYTAAAHRSKDDFIRKFGPPTSCAPLTTGELCAWNTELGYESSGISNRGETLSSGAKLTQVFRAEFDKTGAFLQGSAFLQLGDQVYRGSSSK